MTNFPNRRRKKTVLAYKVKLSALGNTDFGQDPRRGLPGVPRKTAQVADYAQAARLCLEYIREHGLGAGNWSGGQIYDAQGNLIALVSYNGKVWPPGEWTPGMKPLYPVPAGQP